MSKTPIVIVKMDKKEFVLLSDEVIDIYSDNGKNFIRYNGDLFKLSDFYDIPCKVDNQSPISLKKIGSPHIQVSVNYKSDCNILDENKGRTIEPGGHREVSLHRKGDHKLTIHNGSDDKKSLSISMCVEMLDESVTNVDKKDIKSQISNMYSGSKNIKTHQSDSTTDSDNKNKYFTDLSIISKVDQLDHLELLDNGSGSYRDVYDVKDRDSLDIKINCPEEDDIVIKFATRRQGVESNKKEYQTWQAVKGTDLEKYFCPIYNHGPKFGYIVMKKAGELLFDKYVEGFDSGKVEDRIRDKISNSIELEDDPFSSYGFDIHHKNLCKDPDTGDYVLIDYPYGGKFDIVE